MNPDTSGRYPILWVEGKNDAHVVCHLLRENGIELSSQTGPVVVVSKDCVEQLLDIMEVAIKSALGRKQAVGFMLDADKDGPARWEGIKTRLEKANCKLKKAAIRNEGVIQDVGGSRVGVWMMPWSQAMSGKLEDFLREIIPEGNKTLPLAQEYIKNVKESVSQNHRFRNVDEEKAELAAWLAVQDPPGSPYGVAIKAHTFSPDRPLAKAFVQWFRNLYGL